ncbi:major facilitator superfamily domain-containing protein [Plectosphaerella plurivora]|uniref:Major facilitator superfamily domain-containing protein n=1 Tax=Plectosphaerella plurivora TaxID=936078 RepID=A0A9P8VI49_9PEZI|nr:major facilitator superfamily domain-containing protein [Plectosphaerella plurivora]
MLANQITARPVASVNQTDDFDSETDNGGTVYTDAELSKAEAKAALRKIDRRLIPVVGIMYCFSVIGRANLPAAAIAGMTKDLELFGSRYSIVLLVFFPTYVFFQPLSAIINRRLGPRIYYTGITISTGFMIVGMGFMKSWNDLVAIRVLMGALDSGFFPSCHYLLSTWYTRAEVGSRLSLFYVIVCLSYAFGGIMAFGFTYMNGLGGRSGWSWIFIMEGLLTILVGLCGSFLLIGFPDVTKPSKRFLSQRELTWALNRVNQDRGDTELHKLDFQTSLRAAKDFKVWAFGLIYFNNSIINFALANFLPIILRGNMGFSVGESQILVAPPYVFASLAMFSAGWLGDRYRCRGPILVVCMLTSLTGCLLMGFHKASGVRYFGAFITTAGTTSAIPVTMAYQSNNIRGQWKRAFSSALVVAISGIGGVVGSFAFRSTDAPRFLPGLSLCLACAAFNILIVTCLSLFFYSANQKADRNNVELEASDEAGARRFRYTI